MKRVLLLLMAFVLCTSCTHSQTKPENKHMLVGGPCEGCEAIFEYGDAPLTATDTLPDFEEPGTRIKVSGTVFHPDGKKPAKDVILYVYHTNQDGAYPTRGDETGWARRHGYLRGWMKTDQEGKYTFYTLKPGSYPDRSSPAHIHLTVLEPDGKYYWLEDYFFEGDPLLTDKDINPPQPRGGSTGLLRLQKENDLWVGKRDIVLGKNIAGYK